MQQGHHCNWRCYPGYCIDIEAVTAATTTGRTSHMAQQPSVGRIVHYVSYGTPEGEFSRECRAAIITQVNDAEHPADVGLCVMNPTGLFLNPRNRQDDGREDNAGGTNLCDGLDYFGGTWHWPART